MRMAPDQEKWRPKYVFQYIQDWYHEPDFLIDISEVLNSGCSRSSPIRPNFIPGDSGFRASDPYFDPRLRRKCDCPGPMLGK